MCRCLTTSVLISQVTAKALMQKGILKSIGAGTLRDVPNWLVTLDLNALPDTTTHVNDTYAPMYVEELWPNPSRGSVNVSIGRFYVADPATATLMLYNLLGEVVSDFSNHLDKAQAFGASQRITITLPALGAGNYLLVLRNKGVAHTNVLQLSR